MHIHETKQIMRAEKKIALVGNPNVGKSVIFGRLTGKYVVVSNYPGTTVEVSQGFASFDSNVLVVDTPGVNSLIPMSEDEKVTRDLLLKEEFDAVVQVADSKNLRRGLLITLQLAEMGLPFILVLNMQDEAMSRGIVIDREKLEIILGVDVVFSVATQGRGIKELIGRIPMARPSHYTLRYDPEIEEGIKKLEPLLPEAGISARSIALMILAGDESLKSWLQRKLSTSEIEAIEKIRLEVQRRYSQPLSTVIQRARLKAVEEIVRSAERRSETGASTLSQRIGEVSMHPVWGIPILIGVILVVYEFVGVFGAQILVDFLENKIFGMYINPWAKSLFSHIPSEFVQELFVGEYGIITMALSYSIGIVLPIVGTFFIAFGFLEDSGYLPRLGVMVNTIFKKIGLNGKAVLPLILGLGCDTMATLTARILETRKERIIVTLLLALSVPCSAQLGVILAMLSSISPLGSVVWAGVVIGTLLGVGYLSSKLIPGERADFIVEIPPMRMPMLRNIAVKTLARIEWYLVEAVPLFILGTLILFTLAKLGLLTLLRQAASPVVVGFLGLPVQATDAFVVGFLRRDYGAAGLYALASQGVMTGNQILVSLITITLFVPCIANFLIIIKERGLKTALAIVGFIFPFAILVGGVVNWTLRILGITL